MRRFLKYFFLSIISLITLIGVFAPEDPAWVECSNENDLYEYSMDNSYETKNNFEFKNLSKKTFECYPGYYDQKKNY